MSEAHTKPERHSVLLDVARMLSSAENLEDLLDYILQRSSEVMDCEICSILLPDPGGDLRIRSTLDIADLGPVLVPRGKGIAGEVFESHRKVNIADAQNDPRHFTPAADNTGLSVRAMLTIPLMEGDQCLGVMQALNPNDGEAFSDDDEEIFETFGSLIAVTLIRVESQKAAILDAEARQQLNLAREIQGSFLPATETTIGDVRIEAFYEPASEVGGDFYFWHELDGGRILLGIGDVCGKGLPAALDMARGSTLIASSAHLCEQNGLAAWVTKLNHRLCDVMAAGRFIAANFMLVDPGARRVSICVAGLPNPVAFRAGKIEEFEVAGNPPLGIACALEYDQVPLSMCRGRSWLLYSDGMLELQDSEGNYYEDGAFQAALGKAADPSNDSVIEFLSNDWKAFTDTPGYRDDATMIAIRDLTSAPPQEFVFSCVPETLKGARDFVESWTRYCGFDDHTSGLVVLGCDEVFTNICKHACTSGKPPATCRAMHDCENLTILITYHGPGIDNDDFERMLQEPSGGDRIGGLGLHVLREVFDHTDFQTDGETSTIELNRKLG